MALLRGAQCHVLTIEKLQWYIHICLFTSLNRPLLSTNHIQKCVRCWLCKDSNTPRKDIASKLIVTGIPWSRPFLINKWTILWWAVQYSMPEPVLIQAHPFLKSVGPSCPSAPVCYCFDPDYTPSSGCLPTSLIWSPEYYQPKPFLPWPA